MNKLIFMMVVVIILTGCTSFIDSFEAWARRDSLEKYVESHPEVLAEK